MTSSPRWNELSEALRSEFEQNGEVAIRSHYKSEKPAGDTFYSKLEVDEAICAVSAGNLKYEYHCPRKGALLHRGSYPDTTRELYKCLSKYPIQDKTVAIIGSATPWYEAVCLAHGGIPTTIEYNRITTDDERLNMLTVEEYNEKPIQFDAVFSISSYEHDGLGRYGDPIDPIADLKSMAQVREQMLKKGGLLYLAVPIGKDALYWNGGRIYGRNRWFKLTDGFEMIYAPNPLFDEELDLDRPHDKYYQPAVILQSKD
jgi:hypothetical protein